MVFQYHGDVAIITSGLDRNMSLKRVRVVFREDYVVSTFLLSLRNVRVSGLEEVVLSGSDTIQEPGDEHLSAVGNSRFAGVEEHQVTCSVDTAGTFS